MASIGLTKTVPLAAGSSPRNVTLDSVSVPRPATAKASSSGSFIGRSAAVGPERRRIGRSNLIQHRSLFSSNNSRVFGNAELVSQLSTPRANGSAAGARASQPSKAVAAAYTAEQAELVKNSWQLLKKEAGKNALAFFLKVFEIAPSAAQLFSFLRDSPIPIEKNPHLKAHALTVFKLVGDAASELGEKGGIDALRATLLELGASHYTYGVVNEHFDVVKYALLQTIQEALPGVWSPELKSAWAQAYDELVLVIKDEMKAIKAAAAKQQQAAAAA